MPVSPAIGIDLGTTYSCAAVMREGKVTIIPNDLNNTTTPSCVSFLENGHLVGETAQIQEYTTIVFDAKRLIGRNYNDEEVQKRLDKWPFEVVQEEGKLKIQVSHKGEVVTYLPEEVSALVLKKIKATAEKYLDIEIEHAVVTVPAYFNNSQRQATKDAGALAKLNVMRIINEPTAAALSYSHGKPDEEDERKILIYDLGGGTFDVSILTIEEGILEVKSTSGNTFLGGADFDSRIMDHFISEMKRKHQKNVLTDKKATHRLRNACERIKRALSVDTEATIELIDFCDTEFRSSITRSTFEALNEDLFKSTLNPVKQALLDAGYNKMEIDDVVLVGGSTRIPKVREILKEFFNGKELNTEINADEAVAYGAAIQAAILQDEQSEELKDKLLLDITSLSLGIETAGGTMSTLVPRNTPTPFMKTRSYTTVRDNQSTVNIQVFEGERPLTKDNNLLGKFKLSDIPRARAGAPQIDVTFHIDTESILNVTAIEKSSKKTKDIRITCDRGRLSKEEIDELIKKADRFKNEDLKLKECIEAKANLEYFCFNMKSRVEDKKRNVPINSKHIVLAKCSEIHQWLNTNISESKDVYDKKKKELENICESIAEIK